MAGFESGYQQFYTLPPGPLSGLGLQANLTYVNSSTPSYNVVAIYERNRW